MNALITVREASLEERPALAELTKLSYGEYAASSHPDFWRHYESSTRETVLNGEGVIRLIAMIDGQLAASVLYCQPYELLMGNKMVRNPYPEMRLLAVLPQFRNRKLGAALIDACESRARAECFDSITLHTTILMQTAKAMYERRGYVRYAAIDFEPAPNFIVWGYIKGLKS